MTFFSGYDEIKKSWVVMRDNERRLCLAIDQSTALQTAMAMNAFRGDNQPVPSVFIRTE